MLKGIGASEATNVGVLSRRKEGRGEAERAGLGEGSSARRESNRGCLRDVSVDKTAGYVLWWGLFRMRLNYSA